jgi:hypothetical protein
MANLATAAALINLLAVAFSLKAVVPEDTFVAPALPETT